MHAWVLHQAAAQALMAHPAAMQSRFEIRTLPPHACRDDVAGSCSQTRLYHMHDGLNRREQARSGQHGNPTPAQQHVVEPEATEMALTWRMATCRLCPNVALSVALPVS